MEVAGRILNRVEGNAVFLPGVPRASAREVDAEGALRRLGTLPMGAFEAEPGIGSASASRIVAALELGRRVASEPPGRDAPIRGPSDVFARLGPLLRDLRQEEFHALLLNSQHRVIRDVLVTRGILDASLIHPREVFRAAIVESAAGVILVHNHPSGDPTPSPEDLAVTRQLASAGRAVGIPVLDHVVVGEGSFVSLSERGALGNEGRG
jgi:DNA repair protein RadC